jgi:hypothetical protein
MRENPSQTSHGAPHLKTQPCILRLEAGWGVRSGAVGWGTALQAGRSRVRFPMKSLEVIDDLILSGALWPLGRLSL